MKPAYATISANGGLWTLSYFSERGKDGCCTSSNLQGYSADTFRDAIGSGIPCVDFRTMDFDGYRFPVVRETSTSQDPRFTVPLADWLEDVSVRGATITEL